MPFAYPFIANLTGTSKTDERDCPPCVAGENFHCETAETAELSKSILPDEVLTVADSTLPKAPTFASTTTAPSMFDWRAVSGYAGVTE